MPTTDILVSLASLRQAVQTNISKWWTAKSETDYAMLFLLEYLRHCRYRPACQQTSLTAMVRVEGPTEPNTCCDVEGDTETGWMLCNSEQVAQ